MIIKITKIAATISHTHHGIPFLSPDGAGVAASGVTYSAPELTIPCVVAPASNSKFSSIPAFKTGLT